MISRHRMDECLGRLGMLKRFPLQERVVIQISKLLNELCQNDAEAQEFVSRVVDDHDEWPGPSALIELHGQVATRRSQAGRPAGCEMCRLTAGYRQTFKIVERGSGHTETIVPEGNAQSVREQGAKLFAQYLKSTTHVFYDSCMTFCSCPAGKWAAAEHSRLRALREKRRNGSQ
jgi:hypothetical protein